MRIPLAGQISTKDGATNKNSRLYNVLAETRKDGKVVAGVRPGLNQVVASSGNGNSLVCFGGDLINIYGDTINAMTDTQTYSLYTEDWSAISSGNIYHLIKYGNGVFIAVPAAGTSTKKFYKSLNGIDWSLIDITYPYNVSWRNLIWNGSKFLAISTYGATVYYATSTDGDSWVFGETTGLSGLTLQVDNISWNGAIYCMGANGYACISSDGITWSSNALATSTDPVVSFASNGSIFCGVRFSSSMGLMNKAYTSIDGISWTERTLPYDAKWVSITYGGGNFCATTYGDGVLKSATSSNGITWEGGEIPYYALLGSWHVAFAAGKYVAAKDQFTSSKVAVSSDGLNWNLVNLGNSGKWALISTDGDNFILSSSQNDNVDKITFDSVYELAAIGTVTNNLFDFALIP